MIWMVEIVSHKYLWILYSNNHKHKLNHNEAKTSHISPDNIIKSRIDLNQSPASVSELTDTNSSLVTELLEEKSRVTVLTAEVEELRQYKQHYNDGTCTNAETIEDSTKATVQQIVKRDLFPKKKFCEPHELLLQIDTDRNTISSFIMDRLNISQDRRLKFWNAYKSIVHTTIIQTRSSRIGQLRKKYIELVENQSCEFMELLLIFCLIHKLMLVFFLTLSLYIIIFYLEIWAVGKHDGK